MAAPLITVAFGEWRPKNLHLTDGRRLAPSVDCTEKQKGSD